MTVLGSTAWEAQLRHAHGSWDAACMVAFSDMSKRVSGQWPDPEPATMTPEQRSALSLRQILDSRTGNRFHQRGSVAEHAFITAVKRASPRATICIPQPRPERRDPRMQADARADVEVRFSQDSGPGEVFDVTVVNNNLSASRVAKYQISADVDPEKTGPALALRTAETAKITAYGAAYTNFHPYAVDLLGAPAQKSREAIMVLCKKAYSGSGTSIDELHVNRMRNSIIREIAFAVTKATADALLWLPRLRAGPALAGDVTDTAEDNSESVTSG